MNQVTSVAPASGSIDAPMAAQAVFSASEGDAECHQWGLLLSVFGGDLADAIGRMNEAVPGTDELLEDAQAASRRYGLMLEAMCLNDGRAAAPCILYECADGFSVLMVQQHAVAAEFVARAAESFDGAQTNFPETLFMSLLSEAMRAYFDRMVALPSGLVSVQLDGCDYMFMRSEHRDAVLQGLKIGTSAGVY